MILVLMMLLPPKNTEKPLLIKGFFVAENFLCHLSGQLMFRIEWITK